MARFIVAIFATLLAISPCYSQGYNIFWGDSITSGDLPSGGYALNPASYPWIFSLLRKRHVRCYAIGGQRTEDQGDRIFTLQASGAGSNSQFLMFGTNDRLARLDDAAHVALFKSALASETYWLATNSQSMASNPSGWTFSGSWTAAGSPYGIGKYTATQNDTITIPFTGNNFYLGYLAVDSNSGSPAVGTFTVTIDGGAPASVNETPVALIKTDSSPGSSMRAYMPQLYKKTDLASGSHTAVIKVTSSGLPTFIEWAGAGSNGVDTYLLTQLPAYLPNSYQSLSWTNPSDQGVGAYNAAVAAIVSEAQEEGITNINLADVSSWINTATDMSTDGVHALSRGQHVVATALNAIVP